MRKKSVRGLRDPMWKVIRIESTPGLYRLVGPLEKQVKRRKVLCIAIGGRRLKAVASALNRLRLEI